LIKKKVFNKYGDYQGYEIKDKRIDNYINEKLSSKTDVTRADQEEKRKKDMEEIKKKREEDELSLYKIPEHLDIDPIKKNIDNYEKTSWLTGLVEVPLTLENKIKTIEATDSIRKFMLFKELRKKSPETLRNDSNTKRKEKEQNQKQMKKQGRIFQKEKEKQQRDNQYLEL